ncbi:MAG: hypothetical protein J5965_09615 [Aeriscardovia sp.]|nr:hypothetical protein [Aeriscardovia sp.]
MEKGTFSNPYTYAEFQQLKEENNWHGGHVVYEESSLYYPSDGIQSQENSNGCSCASNGSGSGQGSGQGSGSGSGSGLGSGSGSGSGSGKQTDDILHSIEEFLEMLKNGTWNGGYVEELGYVMKELIVEADMPDSGAGNNSNGNTGGGTSGGGGGYTGGGNNGNTGTGGGGTGGGSTGSSTNSSNSSFVGRFVPYEQFYTTSQFQTMTTNGTWHGGNVISFGFVDSNGIINPIINSLPEVSEEWISIIGNVAGEVLANIKKCCLAVMTSSYVQATSRYYSATGAPLHLNINQLGLDNIPDSILNPNHKDSFSVNLLTSEFLSSVLPGRSLIEQIRIMSTAITVGEISFNKVGEKKYTIEHNTYDFDLRGLNTNRDWLTLLGLIVSEGISISADATIGSIGGTTNRAIMISAGLLNRHVYGTTEFEIYFDGTLETK